MYIPKTSPLGSMKRMYTYKGISISTSTNVIFFVARVFGKLLLILVLLLLS